MINPSAADDEAKSLLAHLANHGIKAGIDALRTKAAVEPESLRERIEREHFDLLVMGGYSRPIWLEFLFGGYQAVDSVIVANYGACFVLK